MIIKSKPFLIFICIGGFQFTKNQIEKRQKYKARIVPKTNVALLYKDIGRSILIGVRRDIINAILAMVVMRM